jgi:hypothetical protein
MPGGEAIPVLSISSALPQTALHELRHMLEIVAFGAFDRQRHFQIGLTEQTDQSTLYLAPITELSSDVYMKIATRLATTTIHLVSVLGREIGIPIRHLTPLSGRALNVAGLPWHHARQKLIKLNASITSPTPTELGCAITGEKLRLALGKELLDSKPPTAYLCRTVIDRRETPGGQIVRIHSGHREMSIAIPFDVNSASVIGGSLIIIKPIVGLISRRMIQLGCCQLSLFEDEM